MATHHDHPSDVKHVLGSIYVFLTLFGTLVVGGVSQWTSTHNLLMQFFSLYSSKIEVSETEFFDILATHDDHPSYVKHVLGSI